MKTKRYQCRHIFTAGHRCGSPTLRDENFCYYHHTTRKPAPKNRPLASFEFELPIPEDRAAIQQGLGQILQRIASNQIDPRRAGLLLYGLQIAASILPKPERPTKDQPRKPEPQPVEEIIDYPELGLLAPEAEFSHRDPNQPKSLAGELLKALREKQNPFLKREETDNELEDEDNKNENADDQDEKDDSEDQNQAKPKNPQPQTLPTLDATANASPDLSNMNRRLCRKGTRGFPSDQHPQTPIGASLDTEPVAPCSHHTLEWRSTHDKSSHCQFLRLFCKLLSYTVWQRVIPSTQGACSLGASPSSFAMAWRLLD